MWWQQHVWRIQDACLWLRWSSAGRRSCHRCAPSSSRTGSPWCLSGDCRACHVRADGMPAVCRAGFADPTPVIPANVSSCCLACPWFLHAHGQRRTHRRPLPGVVLLPSFPTGGGPGEARHEPDGRPERQRGAGAHAAGAAHGRPRARRPRDPQRHARVPRAARRADLPRPPPLRWAAFLTDFRCHLRPGCLMLVRAPFVYIHFNA